MNDWVKEMWFKTDEAEADKPVWIGLDLAHGPDQCAKVNRVTGEVVYIERGRQQGRTLSLKPLDP